MATILTTNGNIASTSSVSIASSGSTSLVVSGNPLVYLSSSNRVGVNTNNPSYTLDVNGDVNSSGNIRSVGVLAISASNIYAASISSSLLTSSGVLFYNSAGTAVLNNASKFFWDNTNNKLGIGTSSLNGLIHINANNTQTTNILAEKTVGSTVFSVVPWSSQVYIGAGVYQNAGGWVTQNGGSSLYQLLTMYPGNGVTWFAYGATGTNPASQVSLWNDSGSWISNVNSNNITGSVLGTASWATNSLTSSLLLGSVVSASYAGTASILLGSVISASYALSASYAPGGASLTGGVTNYHPIWTSATTLGTSNVYQSGSNLAINNTTFNSVAPESLLVSSSNYNIIGAYANINNYAQLNLQNFSAGGVSSADIVATNNTGGEFGNFIDMGINGSGFNSSIGGPNDSYLYSSGSNLFVGNTSPNQNLYFFAGSTTNTSSMVLLSNGNFGIGTTQPSASLQVNGNISASSLTGSVLGTSSWSSNSLTASYVNASNVIGTVTSASYSLSASYAPTSIPSQINTTGVTASFTGSLVGNVTGTSSWATNSVSASVINTSNNSLYYFDLSSGSAGLQPTYTATNLTYNPSTSTLSGSLLNISGAGIYLTGSMNASGSVTGSAFYFGSNADGNNMTVSVGSSLNINPRWALQIYNAIYSTFKFTAGSLNGGVFQTAMFNGVNTAGPQFGSFYDTNNYTLLTTNISGSATFNTVGGSQGYNFQNSGSSALFISGSGRIGMGTTASLAPLHIQSSVVLATGSAGVLISQSLSQSAVTASQVYGLQINQTFINVAPNQIQTALKVNPTFTGSFTGSNTRNLIADFSTPTAGTQFSVTDVTSGSIYQVNDVSGLPIAEALSDWTFKLWNYPTVVLIKTGSKVAIGSNGVSVSPINPSASLYVSGSIASNGINISSSVLPNASGSIFYSASKLWVFTGTANNYGAGAGWATASLSV